MYHFSFAVKALIHNHMLVLKASQMGHSVKVSLSCDSLLINTRFHFLYFRMSNC